jgi:small subunit ribosomal protein S6
MRLYETAFLIAPDLSDEDIEALIGQMAEVVEEKKGEMVNVDKWGKRRLAYNIKRFDAAYYVFFLYKGEAGVPPELERRFKQNDSIIRYMTVLVEERENYRRRKAGKPSRKSPRGERKPADAAEAAPARRPRPAPKPPKPPKPEDESPAEDKPSKVAVETPEEK